MVKSYILLLINTCMIIFIIILTKYCLTCNLKKLRDMNNLKYPIHCNLRNSLALTMKRVVVYILAALGMSFRIQISINSILMILIHLQNPYTPQTNRLVFVN